MIKVSAPWLSLRNFVPHPLRLAQSIWQPRQRGAKRTERSIKNISEGSDINTTWPSAAPCSLQAGLNPCGTKQSSKRRSSPSARIPKGTVCIAREAPGTRTKRSPLRRSKAQACMISIKANSTASADIERILGKCFINFSLQKVTPIF